MPACAKHILITSVHSHSVPFLVNEFADPSALRTTSELLTKFSHHVLPVLRRQRYSNTDSLRTSYILNGHVLQSYSRTDLTAAE